MDFNLNRVIIFLKLFGNLHKKYYLYVIKMGK